MRYLGEQESCGIELTQVPQNISYQDSPLFSLRTREREYPEYGIFGSTIDVSEDGVGMKAGGGRGRHVMVRSLRVQQERWGNKVSHQSVQPPIS